MVRISCIILHCAIGSYMLPKCNFSIAGFACQAWARAVWVAHRYHSEWVWVTSPWTTWPNAMPPSGKTVWHPKSLFRGFASSCWCSNDWDALLDWAYYSKPYKDTQTSQSPSCCRLCSVVNPPARPACLLFQCGWQKGRATAWRPGSSLQGYRIYRFYIHILCSERRMTNCAWRPAHIYYVALNMQT